MKFLRRIFKLGEQVETPASKDFTSVANLDSNNVTSIIDIQQLRHLASMSPDSLFIPNLIDFFVKDSSVIVHQINTELAAGNAERVMHLLHSLKGAAMGIGAKDLMDLCVGLGKLPTEEVKKNSSQLEASLQKTFNQTNQALNYLKTNQTVWTTQSAPSA